MARKNRNARDRHVPLELDLTTPQPPLYGDPIYDTSMFLDDHNFDSQPTGYGEFSFGTVPYYGDYSDR